MEGEISTVKNELTFIREDVKDLKGSHRSQIWVLIVAVVGAIVKFGFSLILSSAIAVMSFDAQMIIKREMLTSSSPLRYSSDYQETDPRSQVKSAKTLIITALILSPFSKITQTLTPSSF
jgi:hypothetical protein